MKFILCVLLILIITFVIWRCSRILFGWLFSLLDADHHISFEEFKSLYDVNPNNWTLGSNLVKYTDNPRDYWNRKEYLFKFTFVDYLKYKAWKIDLYNKDEKDKISKEYQEFREAIAQDLEKIKE